MLKSTYRAAPAPASAEPGSLPEGWTEHKAPTGHTYYYNATTKQSTYTKPVVEPEPEDLQIDYNATDPDKVVQASMKVLDEFHKNNPQGQSRRGDFTGGRSYQDRARRNKNQDRPKSKQPILNCEPWILVKTKFGRRFVHNTETKESFWKFPQHVMMAVIEMDRVEWEAKKKAEEQQVEQEPPSKAPENAPPTETADKQPHEDYDSDEYEEVEVTDDEEDEAAVKRLRLEEQPPEEGPPKPVEFDEDDIAWQLAQMDDEDNYNDDDNDFDEEAGEDEDGLPLTAEDSAALFRSLLDDNRTDPYSTFDALIETNNAAIIDDPRWISLPNMSSRRTTFTTWSRDRIADLKAREAIELASNTAKKKHDPRVAYLNFLQDNATPKLYWPEFKRKFRKEPEMKDSSFPEKDREKLYREYISKLKMGDVDRKREFRELLKGVKQDETWSRRTRLDDLPDRVLRDLRFYLVRDRKARDELVMAHINTLKD